MPRNFLITGASKGTGLALAHRLTHAGFITGQTLHVDGGASVGRSAL